MPNVRQPGVGLVVLQEKKWTPGAPGVPESGNATEVAKLVLIRPSLPVAFQGVLPRGALWGAGRGQRK